MRPDAAAMGDLQTRKPEE